MAEQKNSTTVERHLTLVVGGLTPFGGGDAEKGPYQRLARLLARAHRRQVRGQSLDACLFRLFCAEIPEGKDLPVAAITRVLDMGIVDNAWWLRADPVHLAPRGSTLLMTASDQLDIRQAEAEQLVTEILQVFGEDGWVLKAPCPNRWYLQAANPPDMITTPVYEVLGGNVYPVLPRGADGKKWHTILNELQILLHTARVNIEREARGQLSINSLWFWGGGRLPKLKECDWTRVWSNHPTARALARIEQVEAVERPAGAAQWLSEAGAGRHLCVQEQALVARAHQHREEWREHVAEFVREWIEPLQRALCEGELASLTLTFDKGDEYVVRAENLGRWWHRRKWLNSAKGKEQQPV